MECPRPIARFAREDRFAAAGTLPDRLRNGSDLLCGRGARHNILYPYKKRREFSNKNFRRSPLYQSESCVIMTSIDKKRTFCSIAGSFAYPECGFEAA